MQIKDYDSSFENCIDKKDSINLWIFFRAEIFKRKSESWVRFVQLCKKKSRFKK